MALLKRDWRPVIGGHTGAASVIAFAVAISHLSIGLASQSALPLSLQAPADAKSGVDFSKKLKRRRATELTARHSAITLIPHVGPFGREPRMTPLENTLAPNDSFASRLRSARGGSDATVWDLLAACRGYLLQVAAGRLDPALRAKSNPSDLIHETLLEAYRDFADFRGQCEAEWLAWLRRLLVHNLANFERRYFGTAMRQSRREISLADECADAVAAPGPSPSSVVIAGERDQAIERNLERLPEEYRLVIVWHDRDGLPFGEIGRRLHRSPDAARRLWSRAIGRLQELLNHHERAN